MTLTSHEAAHTPAEVDYVDVLIVGAGISGIGAAYRIKQQPVDQLHDPGTPRADRRHLGPVPLPRGALGQQHLHAELPVRAVDP